MDVSSIEFVECSAPGRAGILGNPSDIYGGSNLSCAIQARNWVKVSSTSHVDPERDRRLIDAAVFRLVKAGETVTYHDEHTSHVPISSGLSGSTAALAGIVVALKILQGGFKTIGDRRELAELVRDIELNEAGIICGYQDAYMICHGGLRFLDFAGKHPISGGPLGTLSETKIPGEYLLITTGVERLSGSVHGPMRQRWLDGDPEVVNAMLELGKLAKDAHAGIDLHEMAKAMTRNYEIIRDLGGSGDAIDKLVADCMANGALSAKLAGAGMGGTVIALCENPDELQTRLKGLGYARFMRLSPSEEGVRVERIQRTE